MQSQISLNTSSVPQPKISGVLAQVLKPLQRASTQALTLMLAAGLSAIATAPAYSASDRSPYSGGNVPKSQLLAQQPKTVELTLVSFAVTKEAFSKVIPLFQKKWKQDKGQEVVFKQSYGGSGSQTRAVIDGLPADVVLLALGLDVGKLQKAKLVEPGWESEVPNNGVPTKSVVAIVTRPGNPKGIRTWSDLTKPDIKVITANPKTSGVAIWNFLGLWGSITQNGGSEDQAKDFVTQVFRNVPVLPKDAREATDVFYKQKQGDVLLNYENEVILAAQKGDKDVFSVIPQSNISIDNAAAVVDKNVDAHGTREVAEAFVKFLFTPEAQREFAKVGFRPSEPSVVKEFQAKFPKVTKLYTVKELGDWEVVQKKFFADGGIFDSIQSSLR
jgi:sulfate transport system substrate-binding protein